MGVVVFDADVLIAYLGRDDANHAPAVERMRDAVEPGTRRLVSAVNYAEVLVGPLAHGGRDAADIVDAMVSHLAIRPVPVDMAMARRAAAVRARTHLKLPDAFAVATALEAERGGSVSVRLDSFDTKVDAAFDALRS